MAWLHRYEKFWSARLDRLAAFLEEETWPPEPSPSPASPSSAATTRPGAGLQRLDGPEKNSPLDRARRSKRCSVECDPRVGGRYRFVMRSPDGEHHDVSGVYPRSRAGRRTGLHLGVGAHAGTRIAGDRHDQAGRRRLDADAAPRAILRRDGARPSSITAGSARSRSSTACSPKRAEFLNQHHRRFAWLGRTANSTGTN